MISSVTILSVGLLLLQQSAILPASAGSVEYYVTPVLSNCPPHQPCFELDQYALNSSQYFSNQDNVTLYFLEGDHSLTEDLTFTDIQQLSWLGNLSKQSHVEIQNGTNITFDNVPKIIMRKLSINSLVDGCPDPYWLDQEGILIINLQTDLLHLEEVLIRSIGVKVESQREIFIAKSIFSRSFLKVNVSGSSGSGLCKTVIKDSILLDGCSISLSYRDVHCKHYCQSNLILDNVTTNHSTDSHVELLTRLDAQHRISITNSSFNQNCLYGYSVVLFIFIDLVASCYNYTNNTTIMFHNYSGVIIKDTIFSLGGFSLFLDYNHDWWDIPTSDIHPKIHIKNCTFRNNYVDFFGDVGLQGSALSIFGDSGKTGVDILISHSTFSENIFKRTFPTTVLISSSNVTITNCSFASNIGTALKVYDSDVYMSGNVYFTNNSAYEGGGLVLINSHLHLTNNTNVTFYNNTAQHVGGGILVKNDYLNDMSCFYQINCENDHVAMNMVDNTAKKGGDHIYGASLKSLCSVSVTDYHVQSRYLWSLVFHFEGSSNLSRVSSDPTRVCLCDEGVPKCADIDKIFFKTQHFPGETFSLSAALVGDDFGVTSGTICTQLAPPNLSNFFIPQIQSSQTVSKSCKDIEFTVYSNMTRKHETLVLTRESPLSSSKPTSEDDLQREIDYFHSNYSLIGSELLQTPIYIQVYLQDCPPGFILSYSACLCNPNLTRNNINCSIENQTGYFNRSGSVWLSASYDDNGTVNGVIVNKFCPNQYCKPEVVCIELNSSNEQCAFDHSGTLCGGCKDGYSLVLGSQRCLMCETNSGIALLVFFLLAGFLLVLFIKLLDLTVTHGTINGLIFYANIIWVNQNILSSEEKLLVVKVFIAWINLDFGIETCFFHGLDAYWKTWMQFLFPIYIWTIAGVIIVLCRYSSVMTRLFGNNSLSVLATLILLSYTKLMRTIISIFKVAILEHFPDGHLMPVWGLDGNVPYFVSKHGALFCAGVAAFLFLWLPYTLSLFLVPWLRAKSNWKCLRWINKLKPFFDVNYGPLKDRQQYWIGLLLLVRGFLFIIMLLEITSIISPSVNLMTITITVVLLLVHHEPYKKWYISLLEKSFFANIIIFCAIVVIGEQNKAIATIVSISIALVQFAVVVFAHVYVAMIRLNLCKNFFPQRNDHVVRNIEPPRPRPRPHANSEISSDSGEERYNLLKDALMYDFDEDEED